VTWMIVLYRDIKGANLLVDASGVVKLTDFGLAKHVSVKFLLAPYNLLVVVREKCIEAPCG
jgi:serine/threonine protein kinase